MPVAAASIGPLAQFIDSVMTERGKEPIPLVATHIDVTIRGGLAIVATERSFRNAEKRSIEATLTFPVPVDATLCALSARIDGRALSAIAQARAKARETYEDALDSGKSAILHEELLKGIHMVSVGHLRPGGEVVVTDTWTAFCPSWTQASLRIPTTVGEIYGRSPLAPSDDLVADGRATTASIIIGCENGTASVLRAGAPSEGRYIVSLAGPIDIAISGWTPKKLEGIAADGRAVSVEIEPAPKARGELELDVIVDHSGSMEEDAAGGAESLLSKFALAQRALASIARTELKPQDRLRLWEFNDTVRFVGEATGADAETLAKQLHPPSGGTEIGAALAAVVASDKAKDVLIVTDGKSWALDVQKIARSGLRFSAVLIGEDALEADIAHLAGMSGGQVFVAMGSDAGAALATAFAAARSPHQPPQPIAGKPVRVEVLRRGARVLATWGEKTKAQPSAAARQIAATAAMLAIPLMPEKLAAKLAEDEGIVTHLTSLVLIDEAGERQEGIPASRKVALPRSHIGQRGMLYCIGPDVPIASSASFESYAKREMGVADFSSNSRRDEGLALIGPDEEPDPPNAFDLANCVHRINWDADPDALRRGDLSKLDAEIVLTIRLAATKPDIIALAEELRVAAVVVVIALLARKAGGTNRSAARIARAVLGRGRADAVNAAMANAGL
jgi:hypothetical protein